MIETLVGEFFVAAVMHAAVAIALYSWAGRVAARQETRFYRRARALPMVALALALTGIATSVALLVRAFGAVAVADPATKATQLAQSISMAMNCSALFLLATALCYLSSLAISIVGTVREGGSSRPDR